MRFVIHETWGSIAMANSNTARPDGVTVTVHDSANVYRVVGLFRSEDVWQRYGHDAMVSRARAAAERLALLLEDDCAHEA